MQTANILGEHGSATAFEESAARNGSTVAPEEMQVEAKHPHHSTASHPAERWVKM